jgi:CheY-like chemotaxis protein/HPt (histidine-containing phosphotransfer) domain-containing protein
MAAKYLGDRIYAIASDHEIDSALMMERQAYLHELKSALEEVEFLILRLSNPTDGDETTRQLSRHIHTIKGVAGSYGLELIARAAHHMEDLLAGGHLPVNLDRDLVDRLLVQNDRLTALTDGYLRGDPQTLNEARCSCASAKRATFDSESEKNCRRVLIVEPSAATLQLCVNVLDRFDALRVASVRDGYEALGWLLKESFLAMITSLQVPLIDGQSLAAILRTIPGPNSAMPVILLTSAPATLDPLKARPDFVVEKTHELSTELQGIVSRLIGGRPERGRQRAQHQLSLPKKILLIDDSPDIHDLVRLSFKAYPDVQIVALLDPTLAIQVARREAADLILLDVQMLPISGTEILRELKACPELNPIPVAFFTASDSPEEGDELAALGAWQILKKPFSPKTFARHVLTLYRER